MRAAVVIPTLDRRDSLAETLESLRVQTMPADVYVVDNGSTDGTPELLESRFPEVTVVRNERNLGFGQAIDRVALELEADVLVLVNNDVVCVPEFVARVTAPLADPSVGMVAGVLLQDAEPDRVDSAGIELDPTFGSWDYLWNQPAHAADGSSAAPIGPCGGAAAYRLSAYQALGGFDDELFAYWEDVDLAIRFREAGWSCAFAPEAKALHKHGATLGASPAQRRLHAFGRAYVLGKYGVTRNPLRRLQAALLDWPTLVVHLVFRREPGPIRERRRGLRAGTERRVPFSAGHLATVSFREALARQAGFLRLRSRRELPRHFYESET